MILIDVILICAFFMFFYFMYMCVREGICKITYLYFVACTKWNKKRHKHNYSDAVLALKS